MEAGECVRIEWRQLVQGKGKTEAEWVAAGMRLRQEQETVLKDQREADWRGKQADTDYISKEGA